jgi:hypothetical protein
MQTTQQQYGMIIEQMVDVKKIIEEYGENCSPSFYIKKGAKEALYELYNKLEEIQKLRCDNNLYDEIESKIFEVKKTFINDNQ